MLPYSEMKIHNMESRSAPPGTQAALRAIRLLKAFSEQHPEQTLVELQLAAKLSKTTAHRLLGALESEGLVERNAGTGDYRLGPGALALGAVARSGGGLQERLRPVLEALAAESGETVTLEVETGGEMLIVEEVAGGHLISASANVGTRWPMHATSTGKILLASAPRLRSGLGFPLRAYTPNTITTESAMDEELSRTQEQGFAVVIGELEEGYSAVAVPVHDPFGTLAGAVSIGGPSGRLTRKVMNSLGEMLRDSVQNLSR